MPPQRCACAPRGAPPASPTPPTRPACWALPPSAQPGPPSLTPAHRPATAAAAPAAVGLEGSRRAPGPGAACWRWGPRRGGCGCGATACRPPTLPSPPPSRRAGGSGPSSSSRRRRRRKWRRRWQGRRGSSSSIQGRGKRWRPGGGRPALAGLSYSAVWWWQRRPGPATCAGCSCPRSGGGGRQRRPQRGVPCAGGGVLGGVGPPVGGG